MDYTELDRDRYLWMDLGWDSDRRIHGCLVHIDLIKSLKNILLWSFVHRN
ncbi:MAG: element excision factor XisI family protein [Nostoc sp. CreGUA01]|nr:element excision factor XisI family protein [Nostoc sp. CreGUA01]